MRRPDLWPTAVAQGFRLRRRGWWLRAPFLPLPDPAYLGFRAVTAYGDPDTPPTAADVTLYLDWCRSWRRLPGRTAGLARRVGH